MAADPMRTQLLTIPEVAAKLGTSKPYVYGLISRGEIASVNIGHGKSKTRISEHALAEWITRRTTKRSRTA